MAAGKELSDGNPSGTSLGQSATDLVGFYGKTPIVQRTSSAQAAVSTTGSNSGSTNYGFTTATQADAIVTLVNELRAALVAVGMIKGS